MNEEDEGAEREGKPRKLEEETVKYLVQIEGQMDEVQ
jgi:hypothetical protein